MTIVIADRTDRQSVENGDKLALKFNEDGLIPVVVTCADTGALLMQAYANLAAIQATFDTGEAHYFSRSRQALWHKGSTSGEIQTITEVRTDCDQDCLQYIVHQAGDGCCHVGKPTCFYRIVNADGSLKRVP